jgi:hypothetical protein
MVALGRWEEFALHVRAALQSGDLTPDDLKEILLQSTIYCGVPAGNHAFKEARAVWSPSGRRRARRRSGDACALRVEDSGGSGEAVILAHAIGCDARHVGGRGAPARVALIACCESMRAATAAVPSPQRPTRSADWRRISPRCSIAWACSARTGSGSRWAA